MASVNISPIPKLQFFDGNGDPLAGGLLYTKHGGTNNDKATYTDSSGTVAHANPIVLDSEGRASIFLTSGAYKFILTTSEGAAVYTADGVSSSFQVASVDTIDDMKALTIGNNTFIRTLGNAVINDGGGWTYYWDATSTDADDGGMTIQPASLPAAGRWKGVFPDNRELNLKVFGAACDGTTNDVNAIIACDAYCNANGVTMVVDGTAYFATDPTIKSRVRLLPGAQLKWGNFKPTINVLIDNDDKTQHFNCAVAYVPVTKFNNIFPEWFGETVSSYPIATAASAAADCASIVVIKSPVKITDYFNPASIRTTGRINNTGSASAGLVFDGSNNATQTGNLIVSGYVNPASVRTTGYINNDGTANKGLTFESGNRVSIVATNCSIGDIRATVLIDDDNPYATGVGGGITFRGKYSTAATYTAFAGIKGVKSNAIDGNYSSQLHFQTRLNGNAPANGMILDENKNLIVSGYTNPASIRTTGRINNTGSASAGLVFDGSNNATQTGNLIVSGYVSPASIRTTGRINNTGATTQGLIFDGSNNLTQTGTLTVSGAISAASVKTTGRINNTGSGSAGLVFDASDNATQTGNLIVSGYVKPASVRTTGYINNDGTANKGLTFESGNRVSIVATNCSIGDIRATVLIDDDNPYATGVGGGITFRGKYSTAATYTAFAGIKGVKSNAIDGNYSSQLHFQTRLNGNAPANGMILDENKNLIVSGYTNPASIRTTGRINNTGSASAGLVFDSSDNAKQTGNLIVSGYVNPASVRTTGRINNTGATTQGLIFDSSNNLTQTGTLTATGVLTAASVKTTGRINNTGSASAGLVFDSSDNATQTGNLIVSGYENPASIRTTGRINNTGSASAGLVFDSSDNAKQTGNLIVSGYVNPASVRTTGYINNDGTANKGLTFESGNRVSIVATNCSIGDIRATVLIDDDNPYATGVGGGITFRGKYNTAATYTAFAGIKGVKSNAIDGNYSSQLHFQTRLHGANPATGMILDENKNLIVSGYTNPASIRTTGRINNTGATTQGLIFDGSNNLTQTGTLTVSDSITAASVVAENIYSVFPNIYTATINGCVDETAIIVYGIIGRVVFVQFDLNEVSNSNYLQIVLPVPCYPSYYYTSSFICEVESNGVAGIGYGMIRGSETIATIGFNLFDGAWTVTGTKKAKGSFWYTQ